MKFPRKLKYVRNRKSKGWKEKYILKLVEVKETYRVHLNLNCESLDENET